MFLSCSLIRASIFYNHYTNKTYVLVFLEVQLTSFKHMLARIPGQHPVLVAYHCGRHHLLRHIVTILTYCRAQTHCLVHTNTSYFTLFSRSIIRVATWCDTWHLGLIVGRVQVSYTLRHRQETSLTPISVLIQHQVVLRRSLLAFQS